MRNVFQWNWKHNENNGNLQIVNMIVWIIPKHKRCELHHAYIPIDINLTKMVTHIG